MQQHEGNAFSALRMGMATLTPRQRSMLLVLSDLGEPATISVLSDMTGLHANSVRETLTVLVGAGLVSRHQVPSSSRGRPAWQYEPSVPADLSVIMGEFASFAEAVCAYLETASDHPMKEAERLGVLWGERLTTESHRGLEGETVTEHPLARLRILFSTLGFGAIAGQDDQCIDLTVCPLIRENGGPNPLTCSLHKGMITALLTGLSDHQVGAELTQNLPEAPCVVSLAVK